MSMSHGWVILLSLMMPPCRAATIAIDTPSGTLRANTGDSIVFPPGGEIRVRVEQLFADVMLRHDDLLIDGPTGDGGAEYLLLPAATEPRSVILESFNSNAIGELKIQWDQSAVESHERLGWEYMTRASNLFSRSSSERTRLGAVFHFLRAAAHFQQAGRDEDAAAATYSTAALFRLVGNLDLAETAYERTIDLARQGGDQWLVARSYHMLGIAHRYRENLSLAATSFAASIDQYTALGDSHRIADVQVDFCELKIIRGQGDEATQCLEDTLKMLESVGDQRRQITAMTNLGRAFGTGGQYELADRALSAAVEIATLQRGPDNRSTAEALMMARAHELRGANRLTMGRNGDAIRDYLTAMISLSSLGSERSRGTVAARISELYANIGQFRLARTFIDWSISLHTAAGNGIGTTYSLARRARLNAHQGFFEQADADLEKARAIPMGADSINRQASLSLVALEVCLQRRNRSCREPLAEASETFRALEQPRTEMRDRLGLARLQVAARDGSADTALATELLALSRDPAVRQQTTLEMARAAVRENDFEAAEHWLSLGAVELANGSRSASDLMLHMSAPGAEYHQLRVNLTLATGNDKASIRRALQHALLAQSAVASSTRLLTDNSRLEGLATRLAEDISRIEQNGPDSYNMQGFVEALLQLEHALASSDEPRLEATGIDDLQRRVDEHSRLLVYALDDQVSTLFSIGPEDITAHRLQARPILTAQALGLLNAIRERDHGALANARALGADLLPEGVCCQGLASLRIMTTAPELRSLPFSMLTPAGSEEMLIDQVTVVRAHHQAKGLQSNQRVSRRQPATRSLVVVSDPVFSPADARVGAARSGSTTLPRLYRDPNEWKAAAATATAFRELTGTEATREAVLSALKTANGIVHLATHGIGDDRVGIGSGLFLSGLDADGTHFPELLTSLEIAATPNDIDLVILSACETGVSQSGFSLSEAFVLAGSGTAVATLWSVSHRATTAAFDRFYAALDSEMNASQALLEAQRHIRSQPPWSHPYFWAGFEVVEGIQATGNRDQESGSSGSSGSSGNKRQETGISHRTEVNIRSDQ